MKKTLSAVLAQPPLVSSLEGTVIQEIFEAMRHGLSGTCPEPLAQGEKVIGELNPLEQALNFLTDKYGKIESVIVDRFREEDEVPIPLGERAKMLKELEGCRERFKIVKCTMWDSVKTRLASFDEDESTGWGFREGNNIVLMYTSLEPERVTICSSMPSLGIMVMGMRRR